MPCLCESTGTSSPFAGLCNDPARSLDDVSAPLSVEVDLFGSVRVELKNTGPTSGGVAPCLVTDRNLSVVKGLVPGISIARFRLRGVFERVKYTGGTSKQLVNSEEPAGHVWINKGGTHPANGLVLTAGVRAGIFNLNHCQDSGATLYGIIAVDTFFDIPVSNGEVVFFSMRQDDAVQYSNIAAGALRRVKSLPPYPGVFNGQFAQIDLTCIYQPSVGVIPAFPYA